MNAPLVALDIAGTSFTETYRIGVFHGIIDYARKNTTWKLLYNVRTFSLVHRYKSYDELIGLGASGIIFSTRDPGRLEAIRETGLPAVSITNNPGGSAPTVITDDEEIGRIGGKHLLERGFVNFAFVGSTKEPWEVQRHRGFESAVMERATTCYFFRDEKDAEGDQDAVTARELEEWIKSLPKPIGIMGADDGRALHVLEACHDLGVSVPQDVAILGVDNNVVVCESLLPSLSSVAQNNARVGWEAAALLDRAIQGEQLGPVQIVVPPREVITRMSTDIIAIDDDALARALSFIRENLADSFSVDQIARAAGVSRSLLEKKFRTSLDSTITDLVRDQRLKAAMRLMVETPMMLKEIAEATGFRRATYFCSVFHREMGESPRQWRSRHRIDIPRE
ncbi:DNA-binding transcriptional regulator [bacterium]|nr:DNA-binding transcriptional regulator [bacterium]